MNKNKIEIKRKIANLEHALHEFSIYLSQHSDPDDVPCAIDMEICRIEQELCKEYAKLGISMPDLSEKEKEKWK